MTDTTSTDHNHNASTTTTITPITTTGTSASTSTSSSSPVMVNINDVADDTLLLSSEVSSDEDDDPLLVIPSPFSTNTGVVVQQQQGDVIPDPLRGNNNNVTENSQQQQQQQQQKGIGNKFPMLAGKVGIIFKWILDMYQKSFTTLRSRGWLQLPSSSSSSKFLTSYQDILSFYVKFIASPSNQDKILKFLQYTLYMVSQLLLQKYLIDKKNIRGGDDGIKHQHHSSSTTLITSQWFDKLYNEFTWARYILRIIQGPVALDAAIHQSWTLKSTNPTSSCYQSCYNTLGKILTYSMLLYYPTELMAYLLWMKPKVSTKTIQSDVTLSPPMDNTLTTTTRTTTLVCGDSNSRDYNMAVSLISNIYTTFRDPKLHNASSTSTKYSSSFISKFINSFLPSSLMTCPLPETWSYVSCRCWLIYVVTELIQSYIQYKELMIQSSSSSDHPTNKHDDEQQQQIRLQSLRNLLFLIPCTTWSMPQWDTNPIVPLRTVNTLLWLESIVSIYQAIMVQHRNRNPTSLPPKQKQNEQPEEEKCV